jgi:glycosyltransferase involved in cell wall biosynthesis
MTNNQDLPRESRTGEAPMKKPDVSICIATYNGAEFIEAQLKTILSEISSLSEIILVDDASTDNTVGVVKGIADPRIRITRNTSNRGHIRTFESALRQVNLPLVFLADQDDLWPEGRIAFMVEALTTSQMVAGNVSQFGSVEGPLRFQLASGDSGKAIRNVTGLLLGRRPYFGSAMGFRAEMLRFALPFPAYIEAHDHWLAIVGNTLGNVAHLERTVTNRRVHSGNFTTNRRSAKKKIARTRVVLVRSVFDATRRGLGRSLAGWSYVRA